MAIQATYTSARANLSKLCDEVIDNREVVIINRRGFDDVALIAASELASLAETAHLLRSPRNAKRLLAALNRERKRTTKPQQLKISAARLDLAHKKECRRRGDDRRKIRGSASQRLHGNLPC